jgi:hypothetical protein
MRTRYEIVLTGSAKQDAVAADATLTRKVP